MDSSSYFLTLRPYIEIFEVRDSARPAMILSRPSATCADLYTTTETDLAHLASAASSEALRLVKAVQRTGGKTTSLLLLLSTGGVFVYLLYKRRQNGDTPSPRGPKGRPRPPRWITRGWLWWMIYGDSFDALLDKSDLEEVDETLVVQGKYFGPNKANTSIEQQRRKSSSGTRTKNVTLNEDFNQTYFDVPVAPCPNCIKGSCRIKKHQSMQQALMAQSSTSTANSSPLHMLGGYAHHAQTTPQMSNGAQSRLLPPTSTPESADDEMSDDECAKINFTPAERFHARFFASQRPLADGTPISNSASSGNGRRLNLPAKISPPSSSGPSSSKTESSSNEDHDHGAKLYDSCRNRIPPEGQERYKSPSTASTSLSGFNSGPGSLSGSDMYFRPMGRDESIDSIVSVSGSMVNLVEGAREVRRMIREASCDSLATDFSLDINEAIGGSMEFSLEQLQADIDQLVDNCGNLNEKLDSIPLDVPNTSMVTSKSEYGLKDVASSPGSSLNFPSDRNLEGSTPDLRVLQKPKRRLWKMTTDFDSPLHGGSGPSSGLATDQESSMEWESPNHGWHDLRKNKYKIALSSRSTSECGGDDDFAGSSVIDPWEWDSEVFGADDLASVSAPGLEWTEAERFSMLNHQNWLPEGAQNLELDLEAELNGHSRSTSRSASRRASFDRSFGGKMSVRQPPSGRSSVDRGSGDTPRQNINHESLVKSFGVKVNSPMESSLMKASIVSDESGYQDTMSESVTSVTSVNSVTSMMTSNFEKSVLTLSPVHEAKEPHPTPVKKVAKKVRSRMTFDPEEDEQLQVVTQ